MASHLRLRCPCCGMLRLAHKLGISEEHQIYVDELATDHELDVVWTHFRGRGRIENEPIKMDIALATALRDAVKATLDRIDNDLRTLLGQEE